MKMEELGCGQSMISYKMKKILEFPTCKVDDSMDEINIIYSVRGYLKSLKSDLDWMIEYHDLEKPSQQELFRGCSVGQLMELADSILPAFNRADLLLEVLELNLLDYAVQSEDGKADGELLELLNDMRKARIYYVDSIAGKVFGAFDREMRPYRKLEGTPLFADRA